MNLELTPSALLNKIQLLQASSSLASLVSPIKVLVAYSGGLDSHVLLHLLSRLSNDEITLRAVYINHGLQVDASQWAQHCQKTCQGLNVPFTQLHLNLKLIKGDSIEETARIGRYQALSESLEKDEVLVTAHHQNDQAETLLLQLFRGSGVQGLASMPEITEFKTQQKNALHIRPLLNYSRKKLEDYVKEHALEYIQDPSNKDTAFDRNFLRQEMMPLLRQRWLGIDKTISRAASIQAETKSLMDEIAEECLPSILSDEVYYSLADQDKDTLAPIDIQKLNSYSLNKQRLLIRYWISQQGYLNPSDKKLAHVFDNLINAAEDKQPVISWRGVELRRFQQRLYIMSPLPEHDASQVLCMSVDSPLIIESPPITINPNDVAMDISDRNQKLSIRFRQGGETIQIPNRGNISLKNLFQEMQIPPWIRSRLPLLYQEDKFIKIMDLDRFKRHPPTFSMFFSD